MALPERQTRASMRAPLAVLGVGVVFLVAGLWLLGPGADGARSEAQSLEAAPTLDVSSLSAGALGARVLASGWLAPADGLAAHGLVLFVRQQYEGTETSGAAKGRQRWRQVDAATQAFSLRLADGGSVEVACGDCGLEVAPRTVSPEGGPVGGAERLDLQVVDLSTQRLVGFGPGDVATIDGLLEATTGGGRRVRAERVFGGDVAAYRASRQGGERVAVTVGLVFSLVGGLVAAVGAGLLLRRGRAG